MPEVVHIQKSGQNKFDTYPVFDFLMKQDLKTSSLSFRSDKPFNHPPGSLVTSFGHTRLAFIVESIREDSNGITEVNCISGWEFFKRRNLMLLYDREGYSINYLDFYSFLDKNNNDPSLRMPFKWVNGISASDEFTYVENDPSTSVYDAVIASANGHNVILQSRINTRVSLSSPVPEVILDLLAVGSNKNATPIGHVKGSIVRQLPEKPTHWMIKQTSDSGSYKISSRGTIRTWMQNHAYMDDRKDYAGPYRYETGIPGDQNKQWGIITADIKPGNIRTLYIEIEKLPPVFYGIPDVGDNVSFAFSDMYIKGYIMSKTLSGSSVDKHSITVQPQTFYRKGVDITSEWI